MRQCRSAVIAGILVSLSLTAAPGAAASEQVVDSLCGLFSKKEVRQALGTRTVDARPEVELLYCSWRPTDIGDPEVTLNIRWSDYDLDGQRVFMQDPARGPATELVIGGRPAIYEGQPSSGHLVLELDGGVLELTVDDLQDTDWQPAMVQLGELAASRGADLVTLLPADAAIVGLLPSTIGGEPFLTRPEYVERVFLGKQVLRRLRTALEAVGKTTADVSLVVGSDAAGTARVAAFRVPGTDIATLQAAAAPFTAGEGIQTEPDVLPNGVVGYIPPSQGSDPTRVSYVYPKDDILWSITGPVALVAEILAALPGAPVPPPIPTPAPTPSPDVSTPEGYFKSLLPDTVGGEPLTVQVVMAEQGIVAAEQKRFRTVLKEQGKTIADLSLLQASNSTGLYLQGFRIAGGDAAPLEDVLVRVLKSQGYVGKKDKGTAVQVAGKPMRSWATIAGVGYFYPKDDVLWVVQAEDEATLTEMFSALP